MNVFFCMITYILLMFDVFVVMISWKDQMHEVGPNFSDSEICFILFLGRFV